MKQRERLILSVVITIFIANLNAYTTAHRNYIDYQQHPAAAIIGSVIVSPLAGLIFYWISGIFAKRREGQVRTPLAGKTDDKFYEEVARELREKSIIAGLWTKAYAEMGGDNDKARALYINLRVEQLRNEATFENERQKSETRRKSKEGCLAAEAAKPPLLTTERIERIACFICAIICGIVTLLSCLLVVWLLFNGDLGIGGRLLGGLLVCPLTILFGFVTYRCAKAVGK